MTLLQSCMRNLRRKFYFVLIFGVMGLVYIGSYAWNDCIFCSSDDETIIHLRKLNQPFSWGDSLEENESETNSSSYTPLTCRNSFKARRQSPMTKVMSARETHCLEQVAATRTLVLADLTAPPVISRLNAAPNMKIVSVVVCVENKSPFCSNF